MTLKELRLKAGLTQKQCADKLGIPYRTYIRYETLPDRENSYKYKHIFQDLEVLTKIDEEHGILTTDTIKSITKKVFDNYKIKYAYLFGSYAKGKATSKSDVDILIATDVTGLKYYGLVEELREQLGKKIDLLNLEQLNNNLDLLNEILKDGIKIYG